MQTIYYSVHKLAVCALTFRQSSSDVSSDGFATQAKAKAKNHHPLQEYHVASASSNAAAGEAHTRQGAIRAGELLMPKHWPVFHRIRPLAHTSDENPAV